MYLEEALEMFLPRSITGTGLFQEGGALGRIGEGQGGMEDVPFVHGGIPWASHNSADLPGTLRQKNQEGGDSFGLIRRSLSAR
jgi:hypothetical protein